VAAFSAAPGRGADGMQRIDQPTTLGALNKLAAPAAPDRTAVYGSAPQQVLDVRVPKSAKNAPIAIVVHGGCWLNQYDRVYMAHLADALRDRGWISVNVEYRRIGDVDPAWPAMLDDVRAAVRFVFDQAEGWGGDARRVVITGHSAGGHLALLAAHHEPRIGAAVLLAAITDLAAYRQGTKSCAEVSRGLLPEPEVAPANPMTHPVVCGGRVFLWSGEADTIVPPRFGELYAARAKSLRHIVWPGAGHFDLVSPASVLWPALLDQFDELKESERRKTSGSTR
jgi:acetyl esterase/lipase